MLLVKKSTGWGGRGDSGCASQALRREGVRVGPRTTHRGDAAKEEALEVLMKLAALKISEEELEKEEDRKWGQGTQGLENRECDLGCA
jgi:hypothetical protein